QGPKMRVAPGRQEAARSAPQPDKPFADSERAQKWRLSLASLLFFTVLLSDHLWLCVEARQVAAGRHRDQARAEPGMGGGERAAGAPGRRRSGSPAAPGAGQCFSLPGDAEAACRRLQPGGSAQAELYLPFCNSYTLRELFAGLSRPDTLNCTLDRGGGGAGDAARLGREAEWLRSCRRCVLAYQRYDQEAQDRYREFELVLQKYLQAEEYSVKSGPEDCKVGAPRGPRACPPRCECFTLRRPPCSVGTLPRAVDALTAGLWPVAGLRSPGLPPLPRTRAGATPRSRRLLQASATGSGMPLARFAGAGMRRWHGGAAACQRAGPEAAGARAGGRAGEGRAGTGGRGGFPWPLEEPLARFPELARRASCVWRRADSVALQSCPRSGRMDVTEWGLQLWAALVLATCMCAAGQSDSV
uniref:Family with sequence similarity 155 member A n=1 Tax=Varanus komodoensis TaxID=61221 RepID=A0A8D2L4Q5_VARKO